MRIPITMCQGVSGQGDYLLSEEHFNALIQVASDMGFTSIGYDQLAAWRSGTNELSERPIMFDFDHPVDEADGGPPMAAWGMGYSKWR